MVRTGRTRVGNSIIGTHVKMVRLSVFAVIVDMDIESTIQFCVYSFACTDVYVQSSGNKDSAVFYCEIIVVP